MHGLRSLMKFLDYVNLLYIWLKSYPSLRRTWAGTSGDSTGGALRVNYGFDRVPGPDEHVFGGLVKLQDLNRTFPHSLTSPQILYLISSALPYFPVRMAKIAKGAGAKIVINQNGVAYPGWFGKGWEKENKPMAELHAMADFVIYQSEFCKVSAQRYLGERLSDHDKILYNPVDTSFFKPIETDKCQPDVVNLLLAGSHWTRYRVNSALDTLKIVRDNNINARLKIAGRFCWHDQPKRAEQEVIDFAQHLNVLPHIDIVGPYTQSQAPELLSDCSLLLHTKYNDPCPRLVIEAMSCGLPIVYSATGGVAELVGDEAGIGITGPLDWDKDHPPDSESLADAVIDMLSNLDGFSQAARKRAVQFFDVQDWINMHGEIFHNLTVS